MAAAKAKARAKAPAKALTKAPAKRPAQLSAHAIVEALKDMHFRREVKKTMRTENLALNRRMDDERLANITRGMTNPAKKAFNARAQQIREEQD